MPFHSGPVTDKDGLIEWAVHAPGTEWQLLTTHIAWLHRREETELPEFLAGVADVVLDTDEWRQVRREVKRLRQRKYRAERAEKIAQSEERRRLYMRSYMARRRRRKE